MHRAHRATHDLKKYRVVFNVFQIEVIFENFFVSFFLTLLVTYIIFSLIRHTASFEMETKVHTLFLFSTKCVNLYMNGLWWRRHGETQKMRNYLYIDTHKFLVLFSFFKSQTVFNCQITNTVILHYFQREENKIYKWGERTFWYRNISLYCYWPLDARYHHIQNHVW